MVSQSDQENSSSTLRTVFQLSPSPGADSKEQASLPPQPNPADRRGVKRRSETFMFTSLPPQFSTPLYNQRSTWISFNYVNNIKNNYSLLFKFYQVFGKGNGKFLFCYDGKILKTDGCSLVNVLNAITESSQNGNFQALCIMPHPAKPTGTHSTVPKC